MFQRLIFSCVIVAMLVATIGCGPDLPEGMPKLHDTTVTIMMDGKPLTVATVTLTPVDEANMQWSAGGTTDEQGVVVIHTLGEYEGAAAMKYKVSVNRMSNVDQADVVVDPNATMAEQQAAFNANNQPGEQLVPDHLTFTSSTPIEIEVTDGGENVFTIDLDEYPEGTAPDLGREE
jgi:hypothetical protein